MGSSSGTCEIVEAREEQNTVQHFRGTYKLKSGFNVGDNQRPPVQKLGYKNSLGDDLNQFFEAISLRTSSKDPSSSTSSPLRKNALMKKPIMMDVPHSPRFGNHENLSLKQALREVCISKASEMAAIKRLSKSTSSPRISEAGRIQTLFNAVLDGEASGSVLQSEATSSMFEISLVPEERKPTSSEIPLNQTANFSAPRKVDEAQVLNLPIQNSSSLFSAQSKSSDSKDTSVKNEIVYASREVKAHLILSSQKSNEMTPMQMQNISTSREAVIRAVKSPNQSAHSSPRLVVPSTKNGTKSKLVKDVVSPTSREIVSQAARTEKLAPSLDSPYSETGTMNKELDKNTPNSLKSPSNTLSPKSVRKGKLHSAPPTSTSANRVSKSARNAHRVSKPVLRNRNFVKKKVKHDPSTVRSTNAPDPDRIQIVCPNCQCTLQNTVNKVNPGSPASHFTDVVAEVSPTNASEQNINSSNNEVVKDITHSSKSKEKEKGEFSHSSKSSAGEYSSSTISDDSNFSGSSCGNRPHMSKDVRWEAIRHVKMQHGVLALRNFNLLKKLGCGDIGTVYLAELIGTDCFFAIKVMDNEFLARRKKMPRAQTEREILRMLDHPFLPTLYAQFTSDNLSCLVMEYCPGGDLHVLRQKQPGRSFPEPAARFYVAEVLLALEYLHMLGIVYRDLKPENILVREDGHIMLTDFDLSLRCSVSPTLLKSSSSVAEPPKISGPCAQSSCMEPFCIEPSCKVSCFSPRFLPTTAKARKLKEELATQARSFPQLVAEPTDARSNSFVGTHEYLAPEIIKGEGHGAAVDWWTFGIFLYELLYGKTPFKGCGNDETLTNVILQSLKFPDSPLVSFQARDLIRSLLMKEPDNRLGTEKGAAEIKQHAFFEGLNWALIRCAIPPELPDLFDFGYSSVVGSHVKSKYLECKSTKEHLEFELF